MTRKSVMLIALVVLLGAMSLYLNQDWFASDSIHIYHRSQPARAGFFRRNSKRPTPLPAVNPIYFSFDRRLKLTSLKVVPVQEIETNKYPHPIWALVSDSNSVPTKDLIYGVPVRGMRPAVKGATPDPLVPGVKYRLLVEAGAVKAEHDFEPVARTP
jgi:hypothetical protein